MQKISNLKLLINTVDSLLNVIMIMSNCHRQFGISNLLAYGNDCQLLPDSGSCGDNTGKEEIRYYYSYVNMKCTEFPYSGCGGNANNFKNVEECKRQCGTTSKHIYINIIQVLIKLVSVHLRNELVIDVCVLAIRSPRDRSNSLSPNRIEMLVRE